MIFLDLPTINSSGTTEQQLSEIRSYIYKNNEQINTALSNLTIDKIWEQTASAVSSANQSEDETPKILKQYQRIRDLIIKTADVVAQSDEKMEMAFNGSYLAKSQFGEYLQNTKLIIDETSVGITELYEYHTDLQTDVTGLETDYTHYKQDFENYIKRGLLDNTGAVPIYGIEVGLLSSSIDVDGQSIPTGEKYRTRITPNKWSFLRGSTEVASITEDEITFPKAKITGGSINIGNGTFQVDSTGRMTATSGTFGGTLDASKVSISDSVRDAWNKVTASKIKLESDSLGIYYGSEKSFSLNPQKIEFYKRDTINLVDEPMGRICRESYNGHWGLTTYLQEGFGEFYRLRSGTGSNPNANYAFTYIPGGVVAGTGDNVYNSKGLYIETKLHVQGMNQGMVSSAPDTTIKIAAVQVWGAVNAQDVDVYIDIINGIITRISTTA